MKEKVHRLAFIVAALVLPARAEAHGQALLDLALWFPSSLVLTLVLLSLPTWEVARHHKRATVGWVALAVGATFALNLATQLELLPVRLIGWGYLLIVIAQLAVPVVVWITCRRRVALPRGPLDPGAHS